MTDRHFKIRRNEGPFLIAQLDDQQRPGVFLSAGYLLAVADALGEARKNLSTSRETSAAESFNRLASLLETMIEAQRSVTLQESAEIQGALREFEKLKENLDGDGNGPGKA